MAVQPRLFIPAALCAVALAGYAGWTLLERGDTYAEQAQDAYLDARGDPVDARSQAQTRRRRLASAARGIVANSDERSRPVDPLLDDDDVAPPTVELKGVSARTEAEASFDYAMRRVEKIVRKRARLKVAQWETLYREANDAFAAYSMFLDAADPADASLLEDAHRRLTQGLGRVRVRGKKLAR